MQCMGDPIITTTAPAEPLHVSGEKFPVLLPQERAWLGPLMEAVCDPDIAASQTKIARMLTIWGGMPDQQDKPEHLLYVGHICTMVQARMPWLLPLLDAACAIVLASPGCFSFLVRTRLGEPIEISELIPYTHLLPWTEDSEREAPH